MRPDSAGFSRPLREIDTSKRQRFGISLGSGMATTGRAALVFLRERISGLGSWIEPFFVTPKNTPNPILAPQAAGHEILILEDEVHVIDSGRVVLVIERSQIRAWVPVPSARAASSSSLEGPSPGLPTLPEGPRS